MHSCEIPNLPSGYTCLTAHNIIPTALGYPAAIGALGVQMHMAPRVIRAHEHHVMCARPANAIIAGCTQSTFWARMYLHPILAERATRPGLVARSFLDDISQRSYHRSRATMVENLVEDGTQLAMDVVAVWVQNLEQVSGTCQGQRDQKRDPGKVGI